MRRRRLSAACAALFGAALLPSTSPAQVSAERWNLCRAGVLFDFFEPQPAFTDAEREAASTELTADRFDVSERVRYVLEGGAQVRRADQRLLAERIDYDHDARTYSATGDVRYQDAQLLMRAREVAGQVDADRVRAHELEYQLLQQRGSGVADLAEREGGTSHLEQVTYSTCDPQARAWELRAREMDLDHADGRGVARGATLRLGDVPVLYLPYMTFPLDDRRRSGFLYPAVGYSQDSGFDLRVPYYFNLAPNYDATLTARLLTQRGVMLGGEFRYLTENHRGEVFGSWLPDDDEAGRTRSSFSWHHAGRLNPHWTVRSNINTVSDDRYFEDFGDSLAASSTTLLESSAGFYGRGRTWSASLDVADWEITDPFQDDFNEPFRRLPRALLDWRQPLGDHFVAGFRGEGIAFDHEERPGGERIDLYPYVATPVERAGWFLRPELGYRYTGYALDDEYVDELGFPDESPDRGTEIASLDAGLIFDRPANLFGRAVRQTLEPRLYYLYVPYEDQSDLPLFDTQELTFGFAQLFRTNRFSGADRQTDANQATLALSSRIYDESDGRELMAVSVGQIRYFDEPEVQLPGIVDERDSSPYVGELDLKLSERWRLAFAQQWDPEDDQTELSSVRGQYRFAGGAIANLSYRYRRDFRADDPLLEQVDASFVAPIGEQLRLIGRWNYSLQDESTLEAVGGVEWQSCCYAVRLLGRHYVRNREGEKNNAIYLEIELKGLGAFGRNTDKLLERAILGYTR